MSPEFDALGSFAVVTLDHVHIVADPLVSAAKIELFSEAMQPSKASVDYSEEVVFVLSAMRLEFKFGRVLGRNELRPSWLDIPFGLEPLLELPTHLLTRV